MDELVHWDDASSDYVAHALEQERRPAAAERAAAVYAADDLDELATWASRQPMDLD